MLGESQRHFSRTRLTSRRDPSTPPPAQSRHGEQPSHDPGCADSVRRRAAFGFPQRGWAADRLTKHPDLAAYCEPHPPFRGGRWVWALHKAPGRRTLRGLEMARNRASRGEKAARYGRIVGIEHELRTEPRRPSCTSDHPVLRTCRQDREHDPHCGHKSLPGPHLDARQGQADESRVPSRPSRSDPLEPSPSCGRHFHPLLEDSGSVLSHRRISAVTGATESPQMMPCPPPWIRIARPWGAWLWKKSRSSSRTRLPR